MVEAAYRVRKLDPAVAVLQAAIDCPAARRASSSAITPARIRRHDPAAGVACSAQAPATSRQLFQRRAPAPVAAAFNAPLVPVKVAAEHFDPRDQRRDQAKGEAASSDPIALAGPMAKIAPRVRAKVAAVRNAPVLGRTIGQTVIDSQIVDRVAIGSLIAVLARAAAERDGTATIGKIGRTTGRIEFPIGIAGATGDTNIATTFGTIGTAIGTITITGTITIGGTTTTFTIRTIPTSTTGVGLRGRR